MRRAARHSGYVLAMTLLLLALAASVMAGVVMTSLRRGAAAADAKARLQCRWGAISCQAVLLPFADKILNGRQMTDDLRPSQSTHEVALGDQLFTCTIADEQAKLNINALAMRLDEANLKRVIKRVAGNERIRITLRPQPAPARPTSRPTTQPGDGQAAEVDQYSSFGQIFEDASPAVLLAPRPADGPAARLTLWGEPALNVRRASPQAIRELCRPFLDNDAIDQLISARKLSSEKSVAEILNEIPGTPEKKTELANLLTDKSQTYSMWTIVRGKTRSWHRLSIESGAGEETESIAFEW